MPSQFLRPTKIALAAILASYMLPFVSAAIAQDPSQPAQSDAKAQREVQKSVNSIKTLTHTALFGRPDHSSAALDKLVERGNKDVLASLILASRYRRHDQNLYQAISTLTGENIQDWSEAMIWQEKHPDIVPHETFRDLKLEVFERIDPQFLRFLGGERSDRDKMKIRLEEIAWGGVRVDGIPSLDNPELVTAKDATYLKDDDLVFGVSINGDTRAYPLRIMGWHEMFNEVIGGVPVALAYCTLCGAGILFETKVEGRNKPFVFGSSGFLYRSNKLMFDRETDSLWNQFTGEPVSGPLVDSGIKLKVRPVAITTWKDWRSSNPNTRVLSLNTGHSRDYGSGVVYKDYFSSPDLMFPVDVNEQYAKKKDYVYGIRSVGTIKAWPLEAFDGGKVINDAIGDKNLVLVGDKKTRTVRAYERKNMEFSNSDSSGFVNGGESDWKITEDALIGPNGETLTRVPGHIAYWFAWENYFGLKSELYQG